MRVMNSDGLTLFETDDYGEAVEWGIDNIKDDFIIKLSKKSSQTIRKSLFPILERCRVLRRYV